MHRQGFSMNRLVSLLVALGGVVLGGFVLIGPLVSALTAAQTEAAAAADGASDGWVPARTPWGEPDLQGIWGTVNLTSSDQDEASWSEDQAAVTSAHTVNDRARSIR